MAGMDVHSRPPSRPDESWMPRGQCKIEEQPPAVFFPLTKKARPPRPLEVCSRCKVKDECREYAMHFTSMDGIFGGTTVRDRERLRRQRARRMA